MNELNKVLNADERVLWQGKPVFFPYYMSKGISVTLFGLFWTGIIIVGFGGHFPQSLMIYLFLLIGIGMIILPPILAALSYLNLYFAVTDKRIIIQSGIIGRDFKFLDFDQITDANVDVNIIDKMFGTGTINISSPGTVTIHKGRTSYGFSFGNVSSPYEVFKFVKRTEFNVKTDINYPNQLRPTTNPGYNTQYK